MSASASPVTSNKQQTARPAGRCALLSIAASGVLVALVVWLLAGVVLRVGGIVFVVCGVIGTAAAGSPAMALASSLGVLAWLVGHWLYALRHHYFRSPLARRIFLEVMPALDPTRRWGVPNIPPERRR
jgi:hypothetical protein